MSRGFVIRRAARSNADAIAALVGDLGYDLSPQAASLQLDRYESCATSIIFVAERDDGAVIGLISGHLIPLLHESGYLGRVTALVVSETVRREGVGSALLARLEEWFSSNGSLRVEVTSGDRRPDAHKFYEAQGYFCDERRFVKAEGTRRS